MRPRDLFGVAVRVLGLWFITQGAYWVYWAALKAHDPAVGNPHNSIFDDLRTATFYLFLGGLILCIADPIVWLVYGLPPKRIASGDQASVVTSSPP